MPISSLLKFVSTVKTDGGGEEWEVGGTNWKRFHSG